MSERADSAAKMPRLSVARSLRGLLEVMPSQDLAFYGVTFGWKGIGLIVTRKRVKS